MNLFINDTLVPQESVSTVYFDRGLLLGDGLFETIKVESNQLLFFEAHYQRLKASAAVLAIDFKISLEQLKDYCLQLIEANHLETTTAALRISLTRGCASRGIDIPLEQKPNLFIYATHYSPPLAPKSAYITSIKRNEYSPSVNLKTLNYLDAILAKKQAAEQGYEDGLLLNTQGNAASFTTANLFVVLKGNIITPPLNEGVLNGIIRQHLITIAHSAGIPLMEKPLTVRECLQATEIFATNSLIEIQAIARLNEHLLATGEDAPMTQALKQTYFKERMRYS